LAAKKNGSESRKKTAWRLANAAEKLAAKSEE